MYRVPLATYRIQFNADFTFQDARKIAAYLAELGITDVYASPILRPRKGSTHGYDVVDATMLNPDLGGEDDLTELHGELDRLGMGLVLDIVPNHMAASHENAWWMSVLENGRRSRFINYFDIDWSGNKVLLPILGSPYGQALESGEIQLGFDADGFFLSYYDKRLPLAPQSYHLVLSESLHNLGDERAALQVRELVEHEEAIDNSKFVKTELWRLHETSEQFRGTLAAAIERFNKDFDLLDKLLDAQWYRVAYWRIASETINYRRFFDVTDLVGVKVENPEVFEMRYRRILDLIGEGKVTGLRIDHIDGLYDPSAYLNKLQVRLGESEPFYVVVEKILGAGEPLPSSFQVAGTTGYDFLDIVNAVFVDPKGLGALTEFYHQYTGLTAPFEDVVYERKKQAIDQLFSGEMRALGVHLGELAVADRNARDFAPSELQAALVEITACMPVYRTYFRPGDVEEMDRAFIRRAIAEARRRAKGVDPHLFGFLQVVLLLEPPAYIAGERDKWLQFVMRWQQFTGRVMAKGVEDTAFYNYNRLISLNDVGGEPGRDANFDPVAEFHERNHEIAQAWPHTMNATSTHDTKRAEDVRARINVLSEIPDEWRQQVNEWTRINAALKHKGVPHPNEELLIYQTLVGMWPLDPAEEAAVPDRLRAYLEKASREAKTHTSWLEPNADYENALKDFATAILEHEPFMTPFRQFQKRIAFHGFLNSLSQIVLKATAPGVPDFYQGTELWDFSLVDPDNRRPVDYQTRAAMLHTVPPIPQMLENWPNGQIKLFITARTLATRARHRQTFESGSYIPLPTTPKCIAFMRGKDILVAVPRLTTQLGAALPFGDGWGDVQLEVGGGWRNVFTGEVVQEARQLFAALPVAVLERVCKY
jgi:(1->4)-alpha-D-glucan 1-alpha-D-glucosylmutase